MEPNNPENASPVNARATAFRWAAIRAYQRGDKSFAHAYLAEELVGGWDQ